MTTIVVRMIFEYEANPANYPEGSKDCDMAQIDRDAISAGDLSIDELLQIGTIKEYTITPKR